MKKVFRFLGTTLLALGVAACSRGKRWSERRGIETMDVNLSVVLVHRPMEDVARYFDSMGLVGVRDAIGKTVQASRTSYFAFQLRGHDWTLVQGVPWLAPFPDGVAHMSRSLGCVVMLLEIGDTAGMIGYAIAENGELMEQFEGSSSADQLHQPDSKLHFTRVTLPDSSDDSGYHAVYYWGSRDSAMSPPSGRSIWSIANNRVRELGTYVPYIYAGYFFGSSDLPRSGEYVVQNPGIESQGVFGVTKARPDFVRVDYWKKPDSN